MKFLFLFLLKILYSKGLECEVDGRFYAENEAFSSGVGDCALCGCSDSGLSCDISNCQQIESNRARRNVMQNEDLDQIKNQLIGKLMMSEESTEVNQPEFNLILSGHAKKHTVQLSDKPKQRKLIYLNTYAGIDNFTPHVFNITTTPGKFHLYRVSEIMINKTYGVSFKPSTTVLGHAFETDLDSTGIDPIILIQYEADLIETGSHNVEVPAYSRLQIKNHFYQYLNEIDYLLDFEIDDASTIAFADRTVSFKEIVMKNLDSLPMGDTDHLQLDFVNEKLVLKNFPAKLITMDLSVEIMLERSKLYNTDD